MDEVRLRGWYVGIRRAPSRRLLLASDVSLRIEGVGDTYSTLDVSHTHSTLSA